MSNIGEVSYDYGVMCVAVPTAGLRFTREEMLSQGGCRDFGSHGSRRVVRLVPFNPIGRTNQERQNQLRSYRDGSGKGIFRLAR